MGRKSTRTDKNIYQLSREEAELTREAAAEQLYISADRIEKIETRGAAPHPDEVLRMAEVYRRPVLCNHYCANECAIGRETVPETDVKDIARITLELLSDMNKLTRDRDRLIDITSDGVIHENETEDFTRILHTLEHMSRAVDSLKLWVKNEIAEGKLGRD